MKTEKTISQLRKNTLDLLVMQVLSRQELQASAIITQLKNAKMAVFEAGVYVLLNNLYTDGLLNIRVEYTSNGAPQKFYSLTDTGLKSLKILKQEWLSLHNALQVLEGSTLETDA